MSKQPQFKLLHGRPLFLNENLQIVFYHTKPVFGKGSFSGKIFKSSSAISFSKEEPGTFVALFSLHLFILLSTASSEFLKSCFCQEWFQKSCVCLDHNKTKTSIFKYALGRYSFITANTESALLFVQLLSDKGSLPNPLTQKLWREGNGYVVCPCVREQTCHTMKCTSTSVPSGLLGS